MLEKKMSLRRVEFIFTDGKIHDDCYCEHEMIISEDGKEISRQTHRYVEKSAETRNMVAVSESYVPPREDDPEPKIIEEALP